MDKGIEKRLDAEIGQRGCKEDGGDLSREKAFFRNGVAGEL